MTILDLAEAVLLGLVQGATEFLPVSSSGHLLLLEKLGVGEENLFFNICLHLGTLAAVLIAMRKEWLPLLLHPVQNKQKILFILVASLPTVAIALIFKYLFPSLLDGAYLGVGFVLTACLLFASEKCQIAQPRFLDYKTSILTGVLQGIAVLPGVSRSGATISVATFLGVDKTEAANFSFLLSIPIILGSALYEGIDLAAHGALADVQFLPVFLGALAAFLSGLFAINVFMKLLKKHSLIGFSIYTLLLGILVTLLPLFK